MADAQVTLVGTTGKDPELRFTGSGSAVASFSMAVNRRYQVSGEWKEETSWFDVVAWGSLAENVAASVTKGTRVIVSGRLNQRSWESKEGEKRYAVEVVADAIGPELRFATAEVARVERSQAESKPSRPNAPQHEEEPF